jgi:hypothetical protein
MIIESLTVKMLRSGPHGSYANDAVEIHVSLEDGENWHEIEREIRIQAEKQIKEHWEFIEAEKKAARDKAIAKEKEEMVIQLKARGEWLDSLGDTEDKNVCIDLCPKHCDDPRNWPCDNCPFDFNPY